jgi:hypothetical protein
VSGQLHAQAALPPGESPQYPLDRLAGPQNRCERDGEEENSHHSPCLESNHSRPARILVSILTELPRLIL